MKNNKGQVLVLFLLLLPIIFAGISWIIDSSLMFFYKNKIDSINNDILSSISKKTDVDEEYIKMLYNLNDENIIIDELSIDTSNIFIKIHKDIKPIFGRLIGINKYTVTTEKKIKYESNLSIYFEINNNELKKHDNGKYKINNNQIIFNNVDISSYTLEIGFINQNNNLLKIGNNTFTINNNNLYLNENNLGKINNKNIIDIVGNEKNHIYLNNKYIGDTNNLSGNLIITTSNIKYLKLYKKVLDIKTISNNYNKNRSWLDEE